MYETILILNWSFSLFVDELANKSADGINTLSIEVQNPGKAQFDVYSCYFYYKFVYKSMSYTVAWSGKFPIFRTIDLNIE